MPDQLSRAISEDVFRWTPTLSSPAARLIGDVATYGIVLAVIAVGLGALWAARGTAWLGIMDAVVRLIPAVVAVAIALAAAQVLGQLLPETRPFVVLGQPALVAHSADASFPSDHISGGMAMLAAAVGRGTRAVVFLLVALVGIARVAAGIHWADDVVGGALLGLAVAWIVATAFSAVAGSRLSRRAAAVR